MFVLKSLSKQAVPAALQKAERYRLLNEPLEVESICRDVLEIDADNQDALVTLLLSLTDQFDERLGTAYEQARGTLPRLGDAYSRAYYEGIICERRAKAHLKRGGPGAEPITYEWFRQAMELYEKAEALSPPENDDAVLRWNTCARILMNNPELAPEPQGTAESMLE